MFTFLSLCSVLEGQGRGGVGGRGKGPGVACLRSDQQLCWSDLHIVLVSRARNETFLQCGNKLSCTKL